MRDTNERRQEVKRTYRIYCATNKNNGKRYVGQTICELKHRWYRHTYNALTKKVNTRFSEAIRKHGKDAFEVKELQVVEGTQDEADIFERAWIELYETLDPEKGYNMTSGGNVRGIVTHSPESCAKISRAKLGKRLTSRANKTDERDRPIVELYKSQPELTLGEIAEHTGFTKDQVGRAIYRWKKRYEPDIEHNFKTGRRSSGKTLQKKAEERNKPIIDLYKQGKTRREIAILCNTTPDQVKQVIQRARKRGQLGEYTGKFARKELQKQTG